MTSKGNTLTIKMKTDGSVTYPGFKVSYVTNGLTAVAGLGRPIYSRQYYPVYILCLLARNFIVASIF